MMLKDQGGSLQTSLQWLTPLPAKSEACIQTNQHPPPSTSDASVQVSPPSTPLPTTAEAATQASPPTCTYASIASKASAPATPIPPTHTPCPNPLTGSRPATHSHKLHVDRPKKTVCFTGLTPKTPPAPHSIPPNQLIAHIAGKADAFVNTSADWKANITKCFSILVTKLKSTAPGCIPLKIHPSCIGNLVVTFTPSTPQSLLMSKLEAIHMALGLTTTIPITYNTPQMTIHLANIPTHFHPSAPIFDQATLTKSILLNPDFAGLSITSQLHWLHHLSNITKSWSSTVILFEDPDGTIGQQILKAHVCVFGSPVTIKLWIIKTLTITGSESEDNMDQS
ncbi:hypothetical protein OPQ81_003541 [Rhizoctonia solani]|nr:hypothetical protein OPQ81_003541 [Rhizoctonia solani]